MKERTILIFILIILQSLPAFSQASSDTVRGTAGDTLSLKIGLDSKPDYGDDINMEGCFEIENPTLFYPEKFIGSSCAEIKEQRLQRLNDSIYRFSVICASISDSPPYFYLSGEALAGYDSLCRIDFFDITVNNESIDRFSGLIVNKSLYMPEDYARLASMKPGYPNPVNSYQPISWEYTLDKSCDLKFSVFDVRGAEIIVSEIKGQMPGTHVFSFIPDWNYINGAYVLRISTYSGYIEQKFSIIR